MERKKASDFPQPVMDLFDGYVHGRITRRDFLDRAGKYAVGGVSAAAMLEMLSPNFALAEQVKKDDSRIEAGYAAYDSPQGSGQMRGYLARPRAKGKHGCVAVIHENRGLNPYIEDVARRLATEGFVAFAPDSLTPVGGYPGNEEKGVEMFRAQDANKRTEDMVAAVSFLKLQPDCNGKVGAVGFCYGGGMVDVIATRVPDLAAAVPYYGPAPGSAAAFYGAASKMDDVAKIKAPMLLHFAEKDDFVNKTWVEFESALKKNHVKYQAFVYPNTQHGFHNDTTPRYDEAAAKLSWSRTIDFFRKNLKA
jgi:carboxymethylenebutenolidase